MTRINSKLKVAGILLAALVLALLSVVQISATPFTDPIGYIAYRDKLAELRSANPGITRSEAPAVLVEVKLVDPHTWWQGQMQANAVRPAVAAQPVPGSQAWRAVHSYQPHAARPVYGSPEWIAAHPGQAIDGNTATSP
jgi:hypothetical protein